MEEQIKEIAHDIEQRLHQHPAHLHPDHKTIGQYVADIVSNFTGSWKFILLYLAITIVWVVGNTTVWTFDPRPFILYTFSVSVLAILMTALVLLSQNRQSQVDRKHAENSYEQVSEIDELQREQMQVLGRQNEELSRLKEVQATLEGIERVLHDRQ